MKRLLKALFISILACLFIAGSVIGTSAYCPERVIYYGYYNGSSCSGGTCAPSESCPSGVTDLYDLLKQYGCSEDLCRQLGVCPDSCENPPCPADQNDCSSDCGNSCTDDCAPAPTEAAAAQPEAPAPAPTQAPAADPPAPAPTEAPQVKPTEAPTQPSPAATERTEAAGYTVSEYEKEVVRLVNEIRAQNGLGALSINTELSRVARIKSQDMHDKGYFSHTSPTYGSPFDMMTAFGIRYRTAGENIAMGYRTPQSVVDGWMNSDGHRRNILNSSFTQIGMGYVADGSYWTQMFIG